MGFSSFKIERQCQPNFYGGGRWATHAHGVAISFRRFCSMRYSPSTLLSA